MTRLTGQYEQILFIPFLSKYRQTNWNGGALNQKKVLPKNPRFSFQIYQFYLMGPQRIVGVLYSLWYNRDKLVAVGYGSAFAISRQIISTCTHNIVCEEHGCCTHTLFVPNVTRQKYSKDLKAYRSKHRQFFKFSQLSHNYKREPTKEQLALIPLEGLLDESQFAKFGNILEDQTREPILTIGYPAICLDSQNPVLENSYITRTTQFGKLYEQGIHQNIIKYTNCTWIGCSGCAGFIKNKNGDYKIVLIHTHGGERNKYNLGLYFGKEVVRLLHKFLKEIQIENNLPKGIYFQQQLLQVGQSQDQQNVSSLGTDQDEGSQSSFDQSFYQWHARQYSQSTHENDDQKQQFPQYSLSNQSQIEDCELGSYIDDQIKRQNLQKQLESEKDHAQQSTNKINGPQSSLFILNKLFSQGQRCKCNCGLRRITPQQLDMLWQGNQEKQQPSNAQISQNKFLKQEFIVSLSYPENTTPETQPDFLNPNDFQPLTLKNDNRQMDKADNNISQQIGILEKNLEQSRSREAIQLHKRWFEKLILQVPSN